MSVPERRPDPSVGESPLVSIVTPVFNRASTLPFCLASIAAQTYPNIEHIVVDGGSTDGTVDLLEASDSDSLRWISEKDEGMYDAINKGMAMAKGEVLAYLNSDDLYLPWSVEAAVEALGRGADMIYGDLGVLRVITRARTWFTVQVYPPFNKRYYTHTTALGQPTVFWKRAVYDELGGFDTDYKLIGDWEYWLRTAAAGKRLEHVDEFLAVQVDHGEALRWTQGTVLREELDRMRAKYGPGAGPAPNPRLQSMAKGLRWRAGQWRLLFASARKNPRKWPRFIALLKRHDVRINTLGKLLLYTLPRKMRTSGATWLDMTNFEAALLAELGISELGSFAQSLPEGKKHSKV